VRLAAVPASLDSVRPGPLLRNGKPHDTEVGEVIDLPSDVDVDFVPPGFPAALRRIEFHIPAFIFKRHEHGVLSELLLRIQARHIFGETDAKDLIRLVMLMDLEDDEHRIVWSKNIGRIDRNDFIASAEAQFLFKAGSEQDLAKQTFGRGIEVVWLDVFLAILKLVHRHVGCDRKIVRPPGDGETGKQTKHGAQDEPSFHTDIDTRRPGDVSTRRVRRRISRLAVACRREMVSAQCLVRGEEYLAHVCARRDGEVRCLGRWRPWLQAVWPICYTFSIMLTAVTNPDALPQLMGEFRPVDEWQAHINDIFYALRGGRLRDFYQTFAAADFRLGHALAADYYERVLKRENVRSSKFEVAKSNPQSQPSNVERRTSNLIILELGCGNGNLAATFLTHLQSLDKDGRVYPRVRYILVEKQPAALAAALQHPDLVPHRERIEPLCADAQQLGGLKDRSVDRIICNELWNDLPTKLLLRDASDLHEEFIRPNLSETRYVEIADWSAFIRAFETKDITALAAFPPFLEDIVWEREYRKSDGAAIPFRKTVADFLKRIDEKVLVPVNLGAFATLKEAKRLLAPDAIGLSAFDAGTADMKMLNDPDKPCYGQFGGQYSFMINFALTEAVARHLGFKSVQFEAQKEFVGQSLRTNVTSLMDLLATHPSSPNLKGWEQDRLVLQTIRALNETYESPYRRALDFPLSKDTPAEEREALQGILLSLKPNGVPDTVAYLTEEEVLAAERDLEAIGYDPDLMKSALLAPANAVDYYHQSFRP